MVVSVEDVVAARIGSRGARNPLAPEGRIHAVLFDLDGTLYKQTPIRSLMAVELLALSLAGPFQAQGRWRALRAYRRAHERLRSNPCSDGSVADAQVAAAAVAAGLSLEEVTHLVDEWMLTRPLKYLRLARVAGIWKLLHVLAGKGVHAGILSDYPAAAKLRALGLAGRFSPVLCSTDPDIGALKPDPRGFLRACELWKLAPHEVLMVGDRPDVDGAGAIAAGMPCVIVGRPSSASRNGAGCLVLSSLERLCRVLDSD